MQTSHARRVDATLARGSRQQLVERADCGNNRLGRQRRGEDPESIPGSSETSNRSNAIGIRRPNMTRPARRQGSLLPPHPSGRMMPNACSGRSDASGRSYWPEITLCAGLTTGCPASMPTDFKIGINV
jgi:hypothetical protein